MDNAIVTLEADENIDGDMFPHISSNKKFI